MGMLRHPEWHLEPAAMRGMHPSASAVFADVVRSPTTLGVDETEAIERRIARETRRRKEWV